MNKHTQLPRKVFFKLVEERLSQIRELVEDASDLHGDREFTLEKVDQWISQALEQIQIYEAELEPERETEDPAPNASDWTKQGGAK